MAVIYNSYPAVTDHPLESAKAMLENNQMVAALNGQRPGSIVRTDANGHVLVQRDQERRLAAARAASEYDAQIAAIHAKMSLVEASLLGLGPSAAPSSSELLELWYARLEARVAEIEADDGVMGKKETKRWMDELAAFKADLS